jgi:hypothetical protein
MCMKQSPEVRLTMCRCSTIGWLSSPWAMAHTTRNESRILLRITLFLVALPCHQKNDAEYQDLHSHTALAALLSCVAQPCT